MFLSSYSLVSYRPNGKSSFDLLRLSHTPGGGGAVLTYLAEGGCAALMGRFFTRNP